MRTRFKSAVVNSGTTSVTGYQQLGNTLYAVTTTRPATSYASTMPTSTNTVMFHRDRSAETSVHLYDARAIYDRLTRKYEIHLSR